MLPIRRLAVVFVLLCLLPAACGQQSATGAVIGVRPVVGVVSNPAGGPYATEAIATELARQLQAAHNEGNIPGESALASGQVPLEDLLTVKQIERLIFLQQVGMIEVDSRLTVIAQLRSHVLADNTMNLAQKFSVTALLDPVSAGLRSLLVKITTHDSLVDQARADLTTLGLLRVYGVLMPQAHLLVAAYQMQQLAATYSAQRADLQRRINTLLLSNPDVAPALGIVNAMAVQIGAMSSASQNAAYALAGLRAADYPATRPALVRARQSLIAAKAAGDRAAAYRLQALNYLGL
jgi:hypothetical protein